MRWRGYDGNGFSFKGERVLSEPRRARYADEDRARSGRKSRIVMFAVFAIAQFVFCVSPVSNLQDGKYAILVSDSILHHHSFELGDYKFAHPIVSGGSCDPLPLLAHAGYAYQLDRVNGRILYCYPIGSAILSVPFVAAMEDFGVTPASASGVYIPLGEGLIERMLAALLMSGLACIVFATSQMLLSTPMSVVVALGTAFGTQVWSTASRTLWPQTWLIFLAAVAAYMLMRCEVRGAKFRPLIIATLLSWMYLVRPTGIIPVACVTVYVLLYQRAAFLPYAAVGAGWCAAFVAYSWLTFGKIFPPYYLGVRADWSDVPRALAGTLISPSRGLFIFMPIVGFVIYLLWRYWDRVPYKRIAVVSMAIVVSQVLLVALWPLWWGGFSYGPRLEADAIPWLTVLAILGLAARCAKSRFSWRSMEAMVGACLLAVSVVINARGAVSRATFEWNSAVAIDQHPDRAFDWSYPQFLAGLIPSPSYLEQRVKPKHARH